MRTVIRRSDIHEMVQACQRMESQGYECVKPIMRVKKEFREYHPSRRKRQEFVNTTEFMGFMAVYEKVN